MRFNIAKHGEKRIKEGYLLYPKTIEGETRWLEYARWEQEYDDGETGYGEKAYIGSWHDTKWIDKE